MPTRTAAAFIFLFAGVAAGQSRTVSGVVDANAGVRSAAPVAGFGPGRSFGDPVTVLVREPTKDTSNYSNIGATGNTRPFVWANVFPGEGRQSSLIVMYDTAAAGLPTGADAARLWFDRITFTACTWPGTGPQADYDETPDAWQSPLWPGGDINVFDSFGGLTVVDTVFVPADPRYQPQGPGEDGNAPLELFGVRFNNGWSAENWIESSSGTPAWSNGVPNAEPIDFDASTAERSVQNSFGESAVEFVLGPYTAPDGITYDTYYPTGDFLADPDDGFDPNPFAIGKSFDVPDGTPGQSIFGAGQSKLSQGETIPFGHRFRFEVDTADPRIVRYFRAQLAEGWLSLAMSQAAFGDLATARYSYWITKDGAAGPPSSLDLDPSTIEITYRLPRAGDLDASGTVDTTDLIWAVRGLTDPASHQRAFPGQDSAATLDVNSDGLLDFVDLAEIITRIRRRP